ncbi:Ada metal-binding domain-containing protein [Gordonia otitidis]|uniref:DNA-3-methyladenine glycosylase II n=1 Tax=Gordonia otitidis (strain DSM 44809 / CCUG 52243 / JCM 12355 / NBRC 100426 / IFM 10032) TaxID=1108044 RepID=H5TRI4_GORO1|nr:Ada metal-binding domain-containing protein [Gordonia otitidis]GAB36092.1 3-methyladenine DNA glycosylase [Gordonia otitidis NBRC 100426]
MTTTQAAGDLGFDTCYRALSARDRRFDGQFYVTVHTTGIYCRPSCPAPTPRPTNVSFVPTAAAAQVRGFRACRRCAPDAVPGSPQWNSDADLGVRAMRLITDGVVERDGVGGLAAALGYSPRHLNRVLTAELGAGALALARAHRATTARTLIQRTSMPMADVAFAAGFTSVRQFNDTIREIFGLTPTRLRSFGSRHPYPGIDGAESGATIALRLPYREPFDSSWPATLLGAHAVDSLEEYNVDPAGTWTFSRVLSLPRGHALVRVSPGSDDHRRGPFVVVHLSHLDTRDLGAGVARVRRMLDLDADAAAAENVLRTDPALARLVDAAPGIRLPGSPDPTEALIRTMMGQQISVRAARHHIGALVSALGADTGWASGPHRAFPTAAAIAESGGTVLRGPRRRVEAIVAAASEIAHNSMELHPGVPASEMRAQLLTLTGVGAWTADYVTMVVTGDPDTLLHHDLVVRQAANDLRIDLTATQAWAPWRSYASMHLWRHRLGTQLRKVS